MTAAAERLGVTASTAYLWMKAARATPQFARLIPESPSTPASLILRIHALNTQAHESRREPARAQEGENAQAAQIQRNRRF